jgi:beta-N-acetylhexosaminidase
MPRSPLPRRRSRSVVVRRTARLPLDRRSRPLVTRYGPVAAHQPVPVAAQAPGVRLPAQRSAPPNTERPARTPAWSPPAAQEPPTTVFSPEGLVAWALAPDDGPPTTVLYPGPPAAWSPGAAEAVEPTGGRASSTGAHRVSGSWFPAPRLRFGRRRTAGDGPDPGVAVPRPGGGLRTAGLRLAARANGVVIPAPHRFRLGRRPAVPLVVALVVGIGLALLAVLPTRPQTGAPPAQAALVASGQVTGLALGDDRLPDCTPVVATLSPRQKLAQRLMVGVVGTDPAATARLVHEMQVGGIFVGGTATRLLTDQALRGVQAASRLPLAVAVDDEGGRVQRIDALDGDLPSARTLASTVGPADVQQIARNRGRQLAASGITMNFAPDVDVSDQAAGAVIGDRSFSADADTVTGYAAAYAQGEHEAGIFTVLKHFPGHGHADGDSHRSRVTTPPLDQLKTDDLTPYAGLLRPGGPLADPAQTGVMIGHLDVPGLTADLPASLTPATYQLLRDTYQFDGLTITDDLGAMKAISDELALPEAVQRALGAGADMALWTSNDPVTPVLDGLERGLASGALDPKANDAAVERVLAAKGVCTRR